MTTEDERPWSLDDELRATGFFYEHAGYSYGPEETRAEGRARCARELAIAELTARERGWHVETSPDENGPMEDDAGSVELVASGSHVCLDVWLMAGTDADPEILRPNDGRHVP